MQKSHHNIVDCVKRHSREVPERLAIVSEMGSVTYGQLAPKVDLLARLSLRLGIKKGDIVGVLAYPRIDAYELHLALISVGAIWLGINPKYKYPEMEYITADARPVAFFFISGQAGRNYQDDIFKLKSEVDFVKHIVLLRQAASRSNVLPRSADRRRCIYRRHIATDTRRRCGNDRLHIGIVWKAKGLHAPGTSRWCIAVKFK